MTNGDVGHFEMAGGPLAKRRKAEVAECARILGIENEVLDIHDGELMPSLENRRTVARLIRDWQADIVLGHRPYDYHPDHRYTGVLVDDAAVRGRGAVLHARHAADEAQPGVHVLLGRLPATRIRSSPTSWCRSTRWRRRSGAASRAMPSQFGDKDSWQGADAAGRASRRPRAAGVPAGTGEEAQNAAVADQYRERLVALYGAERGREVKYAEAFELCEYGRQAPQDELKKMFVP